MCDRVAKDANGNVNVILYAIYHWLEPELNKWSSIQQQMYEKGRIPTVLEETPILSWFDLCLDQLKCDNYSNNSNTCGMNMFEFTVDMNEIAIIKLDETLKTRIWFDDNMMHGFSHRQSHSLEHVYNVNRNGEANDIDWGYMDATNYRNDNW